MGSNEKFCLRWNDFERNISLAFREIREEKDFFDCTISCGSRQVEAHKLILSACSPFFRTVLKQNPHQHPLLYLKGVEFQDMQAVLNFMYHGEVNVAQEELNSFLSVAEDLQVKGLTQNKSSQHQQPEQPRSRHQKQQRQSTNSDHSGGRASITRYENSQQLEGDVQEVEVHEIKKEPQATITQAQEYISSDPLTTQGHMDTDTTQTNSHNTGLQMAMSTTDETYREEDYDYGHYDLQAEGMSDYQAQGVGPTQGRRCRPSKTDEDIMSNILENQDGHGFSCGLCGKNFGFEKGHCKRHIRNVHNKIVTSLSCEYCHKSYKNYDSLRHHQRTTHCVYKQ